MVQDSPAYALEPMPEYKLEPMGETTSQAPSSDPEQHQGFYDQVVGYLESARSAVGADKSPLNDIGLALQAIRGAPGPRGLMTAGKQSQQTYANTPTTPKYDGPTVKSAAIQFDDGTILEGPTHFNIIQKAIDKDLPMSNMKDGFVTSEGTFLGRKRAMDLFRKYNPDMKGGYLERASGGSIEGQLASEDLRK